MDDEQYAWLEEEVLEKYEYKPTGLFTQYVVRSQEVVLPNRVVGWDPATAWVSWEADVRHAEQLVQDLVQKDCGASQTPAVEKANAEVRMNS
eukprot:14663034-Heterocapsa_arctica.AAC.1